MESGEIGTRDPNSYSAVVAISYIRALVRSATGKSLTNRLPKLSLITAVT